MISYRSSGVYIVWSDDGRWPLASSEETRVRVPMYVRSAGQQRQERREESAVNDDDDGIILYYRGATHRVRRSPSEYRIGRLRVTRIYIIILPSSLLLLFRFSILYRISWW